MTTQRGVPNFWLWPFNLFMSTPTELKRRTVFLPDELRATHSAYFGASGTGKTSHVEGLAAVDAIRRTLWMSNRGFAIFDVHGDLGLN
ncbi:MAG: hypothetical protein KC547_15355, partial [Anaerolineae bacterium]|nr:hypothetical protein [Anaerolineae bacterium]